MTEQFKQFLLEKAFYMCENAWTFGFVPYGFGTDTTSLEMAYNKLVDLLEGSKYTLTIEDFIMSEKGEPLQEKIPNEDR